MRKILLSNDDGIFSEGLLRLAERMTEYGDVWIVAPESQRSGCSHSETIRASFEVKKVEYPVKDVQAYSCSGTPADCIKVGMRILIPGGPEIVVTGINDGYNCGYDIQYSGTAGAAMEAADGSCVSVAISEGRDGCHEVADAYLTEIIEKLMDEKPKKGMIWNVNIPSCPIAEFNGILENRRVSDTAVVVDKFTVTENNGDLHVLVSGVPGGIPEPGTDLEAVYTNHISIGTVSNMG